MHALVPNTSIGDVSQMPLGTAAWLTFGDGYAPTFKEGDLWLCRLPTGEPIGISDDRHVFVCAGTRTGKGASFIVPNLLLWKGPAFVIDPKGENAIVTARRRGGGSAYAEGMGQKSVIIDPYREVRTEHDDFGDMRGGYNPLDMIGPDAAESVSIASSIAQACVVMGANSDKFFDDGARGILRDVILHVASAMPKAERNLLTVRKLLREGSDELKSLLIDAGSAPGMRALFTSMQANKAFDGVVAQAGHMLMELLDTSERTFGSMMQVARTSTDFLDTPEIKSVVKTSSFQLKELKDGHTTVYVSLPQRDGGENFRWLRMMTTLVINEMERTKKKPGGRPLLMVLDEFPALRRMSAIEDAAAQIAGYGVRMMFVVQSLPQLKEVYKDNWETFIANAGVKLFFGNDDHFTRDYVSKLMGDQEIIRRTESGSVTNGSTTTSTRGSSSGASTTTSMVNPLTQSESRSGSTSTSDAIGTSRSHTSGWTETVHKRALLTPDEIGRVFGDRSKPTALALLSGSQPLFLKRTWYFYDPAFEGKFDPHPDHEPPPTLAARKDMLEWIRQDHEYERKVYEDYHRRLAKEAHERARAAAAERARVQQLAAQRVAEQRARAEAEHEAQAQRLRKIQRTMALIILVPLGLAAGAVASGSVLIMIAALLSG